MPGISDFRLGVDVLTSDGRMAGTLVSVLVEQDGYDPRAIVVRDETSLLGRLVSDEKLFITDELVLPIATVESATHDAIRLRVSAADVRQQPPYLSYRFKAMSLGDVILREAQMLGGAIGMPNAEEVANKPSTQIEIDRGENVMFGKTGHLLGHVQDVLFDDGELMAVVVKPAGVHKHDVVLPVRFLERSDDMALFADIDRAAFEKLTPFSPA